MVEEGTLAISDASRAIQTMILSAWSEGVAALLGTPPHLELLALIPFGYPVHASSRGKKNRKPLSEVVSSERFGTPFEPRSQPEVGPTLRYAFNTALALAAQD